MKKIKNRIAVVWMVFVFCAGTCACANEQNRKSNTENGSQMQVSDISWVKNEDGSYTFTNNRGSENSIYAWYVLDESGEAVYKTKYSESPDFVYDLNGDQALVIKGFVRTDMGGGSGEDEDYEQISMKIYASDILEAVSYEIVSVDMPEHLISDLRNHFLNNGQATLPAESVMAQDGSAWEVDLKIPVDWSCPDISNRNFGFRTNGLLFLDGLYQVYYDTKDKRYADRVMDYIIDWAEQNTEYHMDSEWVWHDDATAQRVLRMSFYYYEFRDFCSKKDRERIEQSLAYQAELLTSDEFYTQKHNHGMHQDKALLVYALMLADEDQKESYIATAVRRTAEYLDYVYTADGIHKEHSPYYARDILDDIILLEKTLKDISPEFAEHISAYADGAQKYLIQITKPDGTWPSLGDSAEADSISILAKTLSKNEEYRWLASDGANGTMPENQCVFPEGGYAVFRSSWEDDADEATWMMLAAATFSSAHKHGDDLEVLLYHKGDLFVEAGKRDYNYSDQMTAWAYSGYAHNVLLVDGEAYPVKTGANGFQSVYPEALETGITDYDIDSNILSVTGREKRFEHVEQTRTLSYDQAKKQVTITDILDADKDFTGTLLFHIAEGVEVKENGHGWDLYRNGELTASVSVAGDSDFTIDTQTGGEGEYPYCTWIFNGNSDPVYGSLLKIDISGKDGSNQIETTVDLK